ncbi:hypothetical protein LJC72_11330 [Bacteroides sp. OttesenSCG-928-D19]|nr:hypothetical protein [Bacteroides sp. OttesenSCG-928-D19]
MSENILHQLEEHPLFRLAECVLLYHSLHDEVYTIHLSRSGAKQKL